MALSLVGAFSPSAAAGSRLPRMAAGQAPSDGRSGNAKLPNYKQLAPISKPSMAVDPQIKRSPLTPPAVHLGAGLVGGIVGGVVGGVAGGVGVAEGVVEGVASAVHGALHPSHGQPTPPASAVIPATIQPGSLPIYASDFPEGFHFGAASSSYQVEGAWNEDDKGESCWDWFCHNYPDRVIDRTTGDVAVDFYHRFEEDLQYLKDAGFNSYRFSISWPRILPTGGRDCAINPKGIAHYHKVLDLLHKHGITPFVTLYHWETPMAIEDKYQSLLNSEFVLDYANFAEICFKNFGDKVKHWITFNEPSLVCQYGYSTGFLPPLRCSSWLQSGCVAGDSATEPYQAGHNIILAHAAAVHLYRAKFQKQQKGKIGITLTSSWFLPYDKMSKVDSDASQRALDFNLGWFLDPITQGDYPMIMKALLGDRLPKFYKQSEWIKGTYDFIGLNYYTSYYCEHNPAAVVPGKETYGSDMLAAPRDNNKEDVQIGTPVGNHPQGLKAILLYIKNNYNNPPVYITENGLKTKNDPSIPLEEDLNDQSRIQYFQNHLTNLHEAIKEGADVKAYTVWSLTDSFEFIFGYTNRFGLLFIDYHDDLKRYPKCSLAWFKEFLTPKHALMRSNGAAAAANLSSN